MSQIQLAFDIDLATCHQIIEILDTDYNEEKLIEGLNKGELFTTTWYDNGFTQYIDKASDGNAVAKILSQELDGEYSDFR